MLGCPYQRKLDNIIPNPFKEKGLKLKIKIIKCVFQ